jgi:small GTP-binding protein
MTILKPIFPLFVHRDLDIDSKKVRAYIWDTAGQDKFRSISAAYYRGTLAALLVYDITKYESFKNLNSWLDELRMHAHENVVVMLVGNKCDMKHLRQVEIDEANEYASK